MKKIIFTAMCLSIMFMCLSLLSSCGRKYTESEVFGSRAAYAISRHIGSAETFNISACDYYNSGTQQIFRAECNLKFSEKGETPRYERHVFSVGTGEYFNEMLAQGKAIFDENTKLFLVDGGDFELAKDVDKEKKVNQKNVNNIFRKFLETGDKSLLGMTD